MKIRSLMLTVVVAAPALGLVAPAADAAGPEPVVAVLDTGVNPFHQEFTYGGPSSTTDQFVAWWDFSSDAGKHLPAAGELWDTVKPEPYDPHGHGTLTASMVAGKNVAATKTPSFAPGAKLAIAKVGAGSGATINGNLAAATRWAVDTVKADVISMSIGSLTVFPGWDSLHNAFSYARSKGVLVVVANGNGWLNAGIPGNPGWASDWGNSVFVLAVGADGLTGYRVTTDPEVTSKFTVTGAARTGTSGHSRASGTSFSAPLVAGFAARLIQVARDNARPFDPDHIERLVKYSVRDTVHSPATEGYGTLENEATTVDPALAHAAAGTLPARPDPDVSALYVESVSGGLRAIWTGQGPHA